MSLKLNTLPFPNLAAPSLFPNSNPRGPSEIQFSRRWGNANADLLSLSLLNHQRCRRDQIRCCGGGGGGGDHHVLETGVWWDLNTCPVPAGVDPRCVRLCIEYALEKQIGRRSAVSIYAMGSLEYISSDLLEKISSSGIILTHAHFGSNDLYEFLDEWSVDDERKNYIMIISGDYEMLHPEHLRRNGFTTFVAYPKGVSLVAPLEHLKWIGKAFSYVFAKEFVWQTLLSDNLDETLLLSDNNTCDQKPLCICNICNDVYKVCDEFITHLKSEKHRNELLQTVAHVFGKPKYFCQVCNYPAYSEYNLFLHNQSEEHNRKLVEKQAQEEEDCKSRKTNPELDLFY